MAKNPNKSASKGFQNELSKQKQLPATAPKTAFTYDAPVVGTQRTRNMGFDKRIRSHKSVAEAASDFTSEQTNRINKRRGY